VNAELLEAVKEGVIAEEMAMRGIDLGSPLWGERIAKAAIGAIRRALEVRGLEIREKGE